MAYSFNYLSTGIDELDKIIKGLIPGDNLVWNIDNINEYKLFVEPFCAKAQETGQKLTYFRFSKHEYLIKNEYEHDVYNLRPELSFERFIFDIHSAIEKNGNEGFYVFDCLSDLANAWHSDTMLGNFFVLTCPYLLDIKALAYFPILKNFHSSDAIQPIIETAQIFINIYKHKNDIYLHPIKVQQRYSPTMFMLHKWEDGILTPVTHSVINAEIFTSSRIVEMRSKSSSYDIWNKTFGEAYEITELEKKGEDHSVRKEEIKKKIIHMIISRDEKISGLVEKYFTLKDLIRIGYRMIGSGLVGGKSVGMLLARAILRQHYPKGSELIERHDSFYIGSDVFYSYMIRNGCWWIMQQRDLDIYIHNAKHARRLIHIGSFPETILKKFSDMLDYFGQSPIIVRSSSLLEDNFGNAFSGKYESVFCPNQGPREQRLEDFISAVKTIYASSMNENALRYRARRGMLDKDELMSLLVQRVSGSFNKNYFYPLAAGVGYSYNQYAWSESIDPEAGVLRLVFGLGTRAVDRADDDYTRLVALNAPNRRPEENISQIRKYSQKKVDAIDLQSNQLVSIPFEEAVKHNEPKFLPIVASRDYESEEKAKSLNIKTSPQWVLSFDGLFNEKNFIKEMKDILRTIQDAYQHPVDVEFTVNFKSEDAFSINILQCRPLETKGQNKLKDISGIKSENIILRSSGPAIGQSRESAVDLIVYVSPEGYSKANMSEKYSIARTIGKILNSYNRNNEKNIVLLGPGRWGTTTPQLGIPVSFSEICKTSFICEIVTMHDNLIPDVSMGTHFFNDLVEFNIFYTALYPEKEENILNEKLLMSMPDAQFEEIEDEIKPFKGVIKAVKFNSLENQKSLHIYANSIKQKVVCYFGA